MALPSSRLSWVSPPAILSASAAAARSRLARKRNYVACGFGFPQRGNRPPRPRGRSLGVDAVGRTSSRGTACGLHCRRPRNAAGPRGESPCRNIDEDIRAHRLTPAFVSTTARCCAVVMQSPRRRECMETWISTWWAARISSSRSCRPRVVGRRQDLARHQMRRFSPPSRSMPIEQLEARPWPHPVICHGHWHAVRRSSSPPPPFPIRRETLALDHHVRRPARAASTRGNAGRSTAEQRRLHTHPYSVIWRGDSSMVFLYGKSRFPGCGGMLALRGILASRHPTG